MKYLVALVVLAAVCVLPGSTAAHVLKASSSVGAILHISPADDPQAGEPVTFSFDFKDTESKFTPSECDCALIIYREGAEIARRHLLEGATVSKLTIETAPYTFPEKGQYTLKVTGEPKPGAEFNSFELTYQVRADRQALIEPTDPEKVKRVSNLIHRGVGVFVLLAIVLRKLWKAGILKTRFANYIRLTFYTATGLWIILQILASRGAANMYETWLIVNGDQQTIHHLLMGLVFIIAGIAELFRALVQYKSRHWLSIFTPLAVGFIGFLFAIHPQHGTAEAVAESLVTHRLLATVLLGGSIAKLIQIYLRRRDKHYRIATILGTIWLICGAASGVMLITYSEPDGAYENFQYGSYESSQYN